MSQFKEIANIISDAMSAFQDGMRLQQQVVEQQRQLSIRIGVRTTQIIRFSMFSILILGMAMFFLVYTLMQDMHNINARMNDMADHIAAMHTQFASVADHTGKMTQFVETMSTQMPAMGDSMQHMDGYMKTMSVDMNAMSQNMQAMHGSIATMQHDMNNMSVQFVGVNQRLGAMGYNVQRMAAPIKMFPFGD